MDECTSALAGEVCGSKLSAMKPARMLAKAQLLQVELLFENMIGSSHTIYSLSLPA